MQYEMMTHAYLEFEKTFVTPLETIKSSLKSIDASGLQILLVVDQGNVIQGIVTDGDIRRAIIDSVNLNDPISTIMNKRFLYVEEGKESGFAEVFLYNRVNHLVVLDSNKIVKGLLLRGSIPYRDKKAEAKIDNPVLIMAGGKGTRLDPFTKILPKPLLPIGDKPIIEIIMDRFYGCGFHQFILSVNYKKDFIKYYFQEHDFPYSISYVEESKPLGTAGSLSLLDENINETVIVTNCDVIIDADYQEILEFHQKNRNDLTIVGNLKHVKVPYGVIQLKNGEFDEIAEKPEYDLLINSGLYYIEPNVVKDIRKDVYCDMTDLIVQARSKGLKIGVYPIYSTWLDVGQWEEYKNTLKVLDIEN